MNVTEEAGKNYDAAQINTVVLCKTLIKKFFCSVQQSLKFV